MKVTDLSFFDHYALGISYWFGFAAFQSLLSYFYRFFCGNVNKWLFFFSCLRHCGYHLRKMVSVRSVPGECLAWVVFWLLL